MSCTAKLPQDFINKIISDISTPTTWSDFNWHYKKYLWLKNTCVPEGLICQSDLPPEPNPADYPIS